MFLFVLAIELGINYASLKSDIQLLQSQSLAACLNAETAASAMLSVPHYAAQGLNIATAKTVNVSVEAFAET